MVDLAWKFKYLPMTNRPPERRRGVLPLTPLLLSLPAVGS
jgi:hypothetical protein